MRKGFLIFIFFLYASAGAQYTSLVARNYPPLQEAISEYLQLEKKNLIFTIKKNKIKKVLYVIKGHDAFTCDFNREGLPVHYVELDSLGKDTVFKAELFYNNMNNMIEYKSYSKIYGRDDYSFFYENNRLTSYECKSDESSRERVTLIYDNIGKIAAVSEITIEGRNRSYEFFRGKNGTLDSIMYEGKTIHLFSKDEKILTVLSPYGYLECYLVFDGIINGELVINFSKADEQTLVKLLDLAKTTTELSEYGKYFGAFKKEVIFDLYRSYYGEKGVPEYVESYNPDFTIEIGRYIYEYYEN
ncbi:MAG: hypothetical protein K1X86_15670 [Ignavibacteria bacterium]|nr:hypothetical protein [Ignavibacteria bacterium]